LTQLVKIIKIWPRISAYTQATIRLNMRTLKYTEGIQLWQCWWYNWISSLYFSVIISGLLVALVHITWNTWQ